MVHNGTAYENLNFSDKILCELSLVKGLQKLNGLCLPIWLDEASTVDPDRIPKTENQLFVISRTDDETLTITK